MILLFFYKTQGLRFKDFIIIPDYPYGVVNIEYHIKGQNIYGYIRYITFKKSYIIRTLYFIFYLF